MQLLSFGGLVILAPYKPREQLRTCVASSTDAYWLAEASGIDLALGTWVNRSSLTLLQDVFNDSSWSGWLNELVDDYGIESVPELGDEVDRALRYASNTTLGRVVHEFESVFDSSELRLHRLADWIKREYKNVSEVLAPDVGRIAKRFAETHYGGEFKRAIQSIETRMSTDLHGKFSPTTLLQRLEGVVDKFGITADLQHDAETVLSSVQGPLSFFSGAAASAMEGNLSSYFVDELQSANKSIINYAGSLLARLPALATNEISNAVTQWSDESLSCNDGSSQSFLTCDSTMADEFLRLCPPGSTDSSCVAYQAICGNRTDAWETYCASVTSQPPPNCTEWNAVTNSHFEFQEVLEVELGIVAIALSLKTTETPEGWDNVACTDSSPCYLCVDTLYVGDDPSASSLPASNDPCIGTKWEPPPNVDVPINTNSHWNIQRVDSDCYGSWMRKDTETLGHVNSNQLRGCPGWKLVQPRLNEYECHPEDSRCNLEIAWPKKYWENEYPDIDYDELKSFYEITYYEKSGERLVKAFQQDGHRRRLARDATSGRRLQKTLFRRRLSAWSSLRRHWDDAVSAGARFVDGTETDFSNAITAVSAAGEAGGEAVVSVLTNGVSKVKSIVHGVVQDAGKVRDSISTCLKNRTQCFHNLECVATKEARTGAGDAVNALLRSSKIQDLAVDAESDLSDEVTSLISRLATKAKDSKKLGAFVADLQQQGTDVDELLHNVSEHIGAFTTQYGGVRDIVANMTDFVEDMQDEWEHTMTNFTNMTLPQKFEAFDLIVSSLRKYVAGTRFAANVSDFVESKEDLLHVAVREDLDNATKGDVVQKLLNLTERVVVLTEDVRAWNTSASAAIVSFLEGTVVPDVLAFLKSETNIERLATSHVLAVDDEVESEASKLLDIAYTKVRGDLVDALADGSAFYVQALRVLGYGGVLLASIVLVFMALERAVEFQSCLYRTMMVVAILLSVVTLQLGLLVILIGGGAEIGLVALGARDLDLDACIGVAERNVVAAGVASALASVAFLFQSA